MGELVVAGDDGAVTRGVELGPAGSPEDLQHVKDADVHEAAVLGVVDLGALDDDGVGGEVDAPGEGGGADEDLDEALGEVFLHQVTVAAQHAGMVSAWSRRECFKVTVCHTDGLILFVGDSKYTKI